MSLYYSATANDVYFDVEIVDELLFKIAEHFHEEQHPPKITEMIAHGDSDFFVSARGIAESNKLLESIFLTNKANAEAQEEYNNNQYYCGRE